MTSIGKDLQTQTYNFVPPKAVIADVKWDEHTILLRIYKSFGIVPNFLGARSSTRDTMMSKSLQVPNGAQVMIADDGSDVESDDFKFALGKKRRDGDHVPIQ